MKKTTLLTLFCFVFSLMSWAQIITSNPAFVTKDYNGVIEITYDATLGTAGLKDYTGTDGVYAHTGVITNVSTSDTDWKHAPTWGDNSAKYKLTSLGNNKWKLLITPNMTGYYGLTTGEVVKKLAFVFRNGLKTKEGKDGTVSSPRDIMLTVYDAGLNVGFTNPAADKSVAVGTSETITFTSSIAANLELFINGSSVATAPSATTLSKSFTYSESKDYQLIAKATAGTEIKYDTVNVNVAAPVQNQPRPAGYKDGITYSADGTQATLIMYAPGKTNVFLIGDMNNWAQKNEYQLKKDGDYWWITITGLTPGKLYGFQYLVDGTMRVSDPYAELVLDPWNDKWINEKFVRYPNLPAYPEGKTIGVVATLQSNKPAYAWEVPNFTMPSHENMVIYEMLFRDFTVEKSIDAALTRLDYLKTLGVTAIELMPIQEFDGNESWGYNPSHFFAIDKAYGTSEKYKKFIDECHKRGIAVILDMVFNHATGNSPFAALYWDGANNRPAANNPWMNPVAPHAYSVFNDFNHSFSGTREHFKRVLKYWITEYKVDGYRMDLAKGFTQYNTADSYDASRIAILNDYYNAAKEAKPDVMFILEHLGVSQEQNEFANTGMYLWGKNNEQYSQAAMGYQENSDFSGMNSSPRQWVGYAESHDEERNFYKAKMFGAGSMQTDSVYRVSKRVPLNIAFETLIPGPKMIWQFGEMGYDYSINFGGSNVANKPSAWSWLSLAHRKAAYDASSKVITLRKLYPNAFTQGTFSMQIAASDWNQGRRIALTHSDLSMVALGNFNASAPITALPNFPKAGTWYELLSGEVLNVTNTNMTISMNAGELKIYTDRIVNTGTDVKEVKMDINCTIFPGVTTDKLWISSTTEIGTVNIYNIQGALQSTYSNKSEIDASGLASGIYLLEINTAEGKAIRKFIKK
ncbi:MAG TPA: alpha-amylase family glycosyl hydrolase [Paludibacteraceae bacterium]|nr:alpha-amylase family glycosyl hydrolase [Paludibacteraceae bacterium]